MAPNLMAGSPEWWLDKLGKQIQTERERIRLLRRYADGDAPLPEGAEGMRPAYRAFQKKARTNWGDLIVEAVQERMTIVGFNTDDTALAKSIWDANQLDVFAGDIHEDMLTVGYGYALVNGSNQSRSGFWGLIDSIFGKRDMPVITREDPADMTTYHDPLVPSRVVAALKTFHDDVDDFDYAYLYLPGTVYVARKRSTGGELSTLGYRIIETRRMPRGFDDVIPVVRFRNSDGVGEFEPHLDLIDRIAYMVLQRLVIVAMQAFRQRAIKGEGELPEYELDAAGNPSLDDNGDPVRVDWSGLFQSGPGRMWALPSGFDLWESQATDFTPVLAATKDDVRQLAAVTRTPMSTLMPEGENQSAEGATFAREGLVFKTYDRMKRAEYGWEEVMRLAMRLYGAPVDSLEVKWASPELRTLSERADAATKLKDIIPRRSLWQKVLQYTPEESDRMEAEIASDMLLTILSGENDGV